MYELQVENMSCGHCVAAVTQAVQAVDGAAKVEVDLATQHVRVDSVAALDAVRTAIADAGYPVIAASGTAR
ncbi:copper chaperone [Pseudoduganella lurida]|uniref:Copper chaperone n=1 Tax=Pseudoduganella lurida TaxID=1036180 RepID=A0A562RB93_9BURK|nr:cation transporter [Pseudoduganella lurida]TWI66308.1 copper chaperone [Pseudoduganella lurida]